MSRHAGSATWRTWLVRPVCAVAVVVVDVGEGDGAGAVQAAKVAGRVVELRGCNEEASGIE